MDCDPGTWGEVYVCRNDKCVGVPKSKTNPTWKRFKDIESCSAKCGSSKEKTVFPAIKAEPTVEEQLNPSPVGKVNVNWRDCGSDDRGPTIAEISDLSPK